MPYKFKLPWEPIKTKTVKTHRTETKDFDLMLSSLFFNGHWENWNQLSNENIA